MIDAWYAGLRRDSRTAFLAGPYENRESAERVLPLAHEFAMEIDPWCHFDVPVTIKRTAATHPPGKLTPSQRI